MPEPKRVFSEKEVSEIMQKAAQLQEAASESGTYTPGVTRDELERVAKEMGIDPTYLEKAMQDRQDPPRKFPVFAPEEERVVEGELDPGDFDLCLEDTKIMNSRNHPVTQVGRTMRAQTFVSGGIANMEVVSRNGRTRVNMKSMPIMQVLGTIYPAFIISTIAGTALSKSGNPGAAIAVSTGVFGVALVGLTAWLKKTKTSLKKAADRLQDRIEAHLDAQSKASPQATSKVEEPLQQRIGAQPSEDS